TWKERAMPVEMNNEQSSDDQGETIRIKAIESDAAFAAKVRDAVDRGLERDPEKIAATNELSTEFPSRVNSFHLSIDDGPGRLPQPAKYSTDYKNAHRQALHEWRAANPVEGRTYKRIPQEGKFRIAD